MYEEQFIQGLLWYRTRPDSDWQVKTDSTAVIANNLYQLSDTERKDLFNLFCKHCGSKDPNCQCHNDEGIA